MVAPWALTAFCFAGVQGWVMCSAMPAPSKLNWRELAARASRLDERIRSAVIPDETAPVSAKIVDARLARWCELAADGDEERFASVLATRGLDLGGARRTLGSVRLPTGSPLPSWTRTARKLATLAWQEASRYPAVTTASDFHALFSPALRLARGSVRRKAGRSACRELHATAHRDLENDLLRRLSRAGEEALTWEFCIYRSLDRLWKEDVQPPENVARQRLVRDLRRRGGLAELFRLFPAFARLCSEIVEAWVASSTEFLRRLARDRPRLTERFFHDGPGRPQLGPVRALGVGAGDEHRGGRSVLILSFDGEGTNRRLVYKPRDLGVDLAWFDLLGAVNAQGFPHPFREVKIWPRGSRYGWMEFVAASPYRGRMARARYGWRAGALACLFHALGGTDGHRGNLVAADDQPVLVDLETLLHHPDPEHVNPWPLARTVFRTALLPLPQSGEERTAALQKEARWNFPPAFGTAGTGAKLEVNADKLLDGFQTMVSLLSAERPFPAFVKRMRCLTRQRVRRVLLPTALYDLLRRRSLAAGCLREGIDRSLEFEFLHRVELGENRREPWLAEEIRALERLDIPYFVVLPRTKRRGYEDSFPTGWLPGTGLGADRTTTSVSALRRHLEEQVALLASIYPNRGSRRH